MIIDFLYVIVPCRRLRVFVLRRRELSGAEAVDACRQKEVQHEPAMALDGGESGLDFYRRIVPLWKSKLKAGGALAFELGEGQYDEVSRILADNGFGGITESIDFGGVQRAIIGTLLQK